MKKNIIIIILLFVLITASVSTADVIPCGNEPGHYQDEFGNVYCSNEKLDFFTVENKVCMEGFK